MKKTKIALLTLALLGLVGCTRENISSSGKVSTPASDSVASVSSSTPGASSSASSVSDVSSSLDSTIPVSSSKGDGGSDTEDSSSSSSYNPYSEGWAKDITDTMLKYLGGNVLPYIDLGRSVDATWDVSTSDLGVLSITGLAEWVSGTGGTIDTYKATLATHPEWAVSKTSSKELAADNATAGVHLKLSKDDGNFIKLTATYDEPYDLTAATDWDNDVKTELTTTFGDVIPFVYLGTKNPTAEVSSYSDEPTMYLYGGKWDAQVLSDATTALTAAGYTVTATDSTTIKAIGKATNGKDEFNITITQDGYSVQKIRMKVVFEEGWDLDNAPTEWDDDTKDIIADDMGGHDFPYVYLGKKQTSGSWSSYYNSLTIKGGLWNDQVLTLATTAFAGWNPVSSLPDKKFTAEKTFDNGDKISVVINTDSNGKILLTAKFEEGYNIPADATAWSSDTITAFNTYLDGHADKIPFVYLNSTTESADWNDSSYVLTVTGGTFNSLMLTTAKAVFGAVTDASGNKVWTEVVDSSVYYDYVSFHGVMDDGCTMDITFTTNYNNDALMKIKFLKFYDPTVGTDYDATTKAEVKKRLCGHDLPYFYLGVDKPKVEWSYSDQELTLQGAPFQEAMLTAAKTAYENAGWTTATNTSSSSTVLTAEKEFDDCYLSVEIGKNTYDNILIKVFKDENFDLSKGTDWSAETKAAMTSEIGVVLPYVYLGTDYDSSSFYSSRNELDIYGNCWNYRLLENAKTIYENNGYTCDLNGSTLTMCKKETAINGFVLVKLYKNFNGFPLMEIYKELKTSTVPEGGAYAADVSTAILNYTKNHEIPFIYMGSGSYSTLKLSYSNEFEVRGDEWTSDNALAAAKKLENDGWTYSLDVYNGSLRVIASKTFEDKSKISLKAYGTYSGTGEIDIVYTDPFIAPEGVTSWSNSISRKISKKLDGGSIPFVYLGTNNPSFSDRDYGFEIDGEIWDDSIWDSAYNAFKADGWNVIWDYTGTSSSYSNKRVYARKEIGGKICTAITYCYASKPEIDVYYE